jgi:hypothetical protein
MVRDCKSDGGLIPRAMPAGSSLVQFQLSLSTPVIGFQSKHIDQSRRLQWMVSRQLVSEISNIIKLQVVVFWYSSHICGVVVVARQRMHTLHSIGIVIVASPTRNVGHVVPYQLVQIDHFDIGKAVDYR